MARANTRRARARGAGRQRSTPVTPDTLTIEDIRKLVGVPSLTQGNTTAVPQRTYGLLDALAAGTGQASLQLVGVPMPRDPRDDNAFGPGKPLDPAPLDAPNPVTGQPDPRIYEYPVSWNMPGNGRREVPWQVLITASTAVDIIRQCIETRKRDIRKLKWRWNVTDQAVQDAYESNPNAGREDAESTLRKKWAPWIAKMTDFWCEPWRSNEIDFGQWCNLVMEEVIVLDALAVWPERAVAGNVLGFEVIDGSTVKPLLDVRGRRPAPPFPAYQQELYGFPRGDYAASIEGYDTDGKPIFGGKTYTPAQLFYHRENVRSRSPYGLSEVEQSLISARLYLRRQGWMLAEYDDGSTPITWVTPPGDAANVDRFTPATRRAWEDGINAALGGDTARRNRIKVGPPGWEIQQLTTVDERYKPEYDIHLIKLVAGHLHVPITKLGYTEAKGLGDTGYHESMADVSGEIGEEPDVRMLTGIIMKLSRRFLDCPAELEIQFISPDAEDAQAEDAVADLQRKRGTLTLNDDRRRLGEATYNFPEADMPMLIGVGPSGVMFLEGLHASQKAQEDLQMAAGQAQIASTLPPDEGDSGGDTTKTVTVSDELEAWRRWRRRQSDTPRRPFMFKTATPDDLPVAGHDPAWMAFQGYEWVADIDKGSVLEWNAANPLHPRGPNGRFVKFGSFEGNVLDSLASTGAKVVRPMTRFHEDALDEATRRVSAGKPIRRGESTLADDLETRGLLEEHGGPGKNKNRLELSDAGRAHLVARQPDAYAKPATVEPPKARSDADTLALSQPGASPTAPAVPEPTFSSDELRAARRELHEFDDMESRASSALDPDAKSTPRAVFTDADVREQALRRRERAATTDTRPDLRTMRRDVVAQHGKDELDWPAEARTSIRDREREEFMRGAQVQYETMPEGPERDKFVAETSAVFDMLQTGRRVSESLEAAIEQRRADEERAGRDPEFREWLNEHKARGLVLLMGGDPGPATPRPPERAVAVAVPEATVENALGQGLPDRLRQAEIMYGTDRATWPAAVRAEETKIKMREAAAARRAARQLPPIPLEVESDTLTPPVGDTRQGGHMAEHYVTPPTREEEEARVLHERLAFIDGLIEDAQVEVDGLSAVKMPSGATKAQRQAHAAELERARAELNRLHTAHARVAAESPEVVEGELEGDLPISETVIPIGRTGRARLGDAGQERAADTVRDVVDEVRPAGLLNPDFSVNPAAVRTALAGVDSREEAAALIDRLALKVPELRQLAKDLDVVLVGRTKADMRRDIVEQRVGGRLDAGAIAEGVRDQGARRVAPAPMSVEQAQAEYDAAVKARDEGFGRRGVRRTHMDSVRSREMQAKEEQLRQVMAYHEANLASTPTTSGLERLMGGRVEGQAPIPSAPSAAPVREPKPRRTGKPPASAAAAPGLERLMGGPLKPDEFGTAGKPAPSADERQLAIQVASYERLVQRAEGLDNSINFAEDDEDRSALQDEREDVERQMTVLDRQIEQARRRAKRKGKR